MWSHEGRVDNVKVEVFFVLIAVPSSNVRVPKTHIRKTTNPEMTPSLQVNFGKTKKIRRNFFVDTKNLIGCNAVGNASLMFH